MDDAKTLGRTRLSFATEADVDEFADTLAKFERGEIGPDQWRAFRLLRGTYGQRQDDEQMLRVKIPQGVLDRAQLQALANVAERHSRGFGHITTRQNVQFHFLKLHDVETAMRELAEAGLTTREACGHSVRNITCCPYAGVSPSEAFDVTPYAEAMTRYFLRHPLSSSLPRKFKIAFEGCSEDHSALAIHDIGAWGFVDPNGVRRFKITVAGGTSIMCRSGQTLVEALPAAELLSVAEAILRVFQRFGDYQHKHKNRLKFLLKQLGWERFSAEINAVISELRQSVPRIDEVVDETPAVGAVPIAVSELVRIGASSQVRGPGIAPNVRADLTPTGYPRWKETNTRVQKQPGYAIVTVSVPLGDLTGGQLRALGEIAARESDGMLRLTAEQDLVLRWVPAARLQSVYEQLAAIGLGLGEASTIANVTSCPGAESCKLAVTQSRGLGRLLEEHIRNNPWLIGAAPDLRIKMSGCPNGCGRHHIAGIGFQGSVRKIDGKAVPQYFVMIGGKSAFSETRFARLVAKITARRIPQALDRLIELYVRDRHDGESATDFFARVDPKRASEVLAPLEALTAEQATPEDFIDLGEAAAFKPETSDGECAA